MWKTLISAVLAGETRQLATRARLAAITYGLAGLSLAVAAGFLIAAGYMATAARLGRFDAAILFAAGFFAVAILLLIGYAIGRRIAQRRRRVERASEWQSVAVASAIALLPGLARSKLGLATLLTPLAGLVAYRILEENRGSGTVPRTRPRARPADRYRAGL